jgi:hypothetical protein
MVAIEVVKKGINIVSRVHSCASTSVCCKSIGAYVNPIYCQEGSDVWVGSFGFSVGLGVDIAVAVGGAGVNVAVVNVVGLSEG